MTTEFCIASASQLLMCGLIAGLAFDPAAGRADLLVSHVISAGAASDGAREDVAACAKSGYSVSATVVDRNSNLIAVLRGDGAGAHTIDVSRGKAFGASSYAPIYGMESTATVGKLKASQSGFQVPDHMVLRGDGITIKVGTEIVGAIGVSGSPGAEFEETCARVVADTIKASFP